eukprot:TRINITY_DN16786_c0_g1_i1.p1 TRINITY_DN16786_c0_g1~~TRINITY_DN16786_c0_g1_i1.p1  ORF type:complete len:416 (-),score=57.35 TRINITY_DN16786_c0_g1_i1:129-1376(-)
MAMRCGSCVKFVIALAASSVLVWYWYAVDDHRLHSYGYDCTSDLSIRLVKQGSAKGLALDDETYGCPTELPVHWPHTGEPVRLLRLFKSVQPGWDEGTISDFASKIAAYARRNDAKVLVGTQITCNEYEDDVDWTHTRSLLKYLGPSHVLGLAVGNELDLLYAKEGTTMECVDRIWGGHLFKKLQDRIVEMRSLKGFENIPVTTVFTAGVVWDTGGLPFKDTREMKVNTFFKRVLDAGIKDWVFTFNFYPYFDPSLQLDPDGEHCEGALATCRCFDKPSCATFISMAQARRQLKMLTGNDNDRFWVGELGWSAPLASTLTTAMKYCKEFSGYRMFYDYYREFLAWDLTIPSYAAPEHVFYFSVRDSHNFGMKEHFGLIGKCKEAQCKLNYSAVQHSDRGVSHHTTDLKEALELAI